MKFMFILLWLMTLLLCGLLGYVTLLAWPTFTFWLRTWLLFIDTCMIISFGITTYSIFTTIKEN